MANNMYEPNRGYNPFAPASYGYSPDSPQDLLPQISTPQAVELRTPEESVMDKATGLAMDKGLNYGADKGTEMATKALAGGKGGAESVVGKHIAANSAGTAGAAGATGAMAGIGAAMAPVLPVIIGAMALKSIFKK